MPLKWQICTVPQKDDDDGSWPHVRILLILYSRTIPIWFQKETHIHLFLGLIVFNAHTFSGVFYWPHLYKSSFTVIVREFVCYPVAQIDTLLYDSRSYLPCDAYICQAHTHSRNRECRQTFQSYRNSNDIYGTNDHRHNIINSFSFWIKRERKREKVALRADRMSVDWKSLESWRVGCIGLYCIAEMCRNYAKERKRDHIRKFNVVMVSVLTSLSMFIWVMTWENLCTVQYSERGEFRIRWFDGDGGMR